MPKKIDDATRAEALRRVLGGELISKSAGCPSRSG